MVSPIFVGGFEILSPVYVRLAEGPAQVAHAFLSCGGEVCFFSVMRLANAKWMEVNGL